MTPDRELRLEASNSPQTSSLECLVSPRVYSQSWSTARCQIECLPCAIPDHSSILSTKAFECNGAGQPLQPGMDWTRLKRGVLCQQTLLMMDSPQRDEMSWAIVELCCMRGRELSRLSVDWVYLMRTRRSESQVPFSARCLSARPSCFLAADAGFSWPRARAHSELQQLWDYSGFIDLSKEPQTCWAGVEPGPHIQEATKLAAVNTVQMAFTHSRYTWWCCCPTSFKM